MTFAEKFNIRSQRQFCVLISPLDWGLGHASRCIPIIKYLKSIDCKVIIATGGLQQQLLLEEFPDLTFIKLDGYKITFSNNRVKTLMRVVMQVPKILTAINREKRWLNKFLIKNEIDLVISDNRYGLFSKGVPSIFITHQLTIKTPFGRTFERLLRATNYRYINKFTECWVPDFEGQDNMAGELSHPNKKPRLPVKFLGRLSRIGNIEPGEQKIRLLIILSGPEPQRSIFEKMIMLQLGAYTHATVLVRGLPGEAKQMQNYYKNLTIYNHLGSSQLNELLNATTFIISRSGYSTIMDLIALNKKCIFIPTPGQTEQEYLARYLSSKKFCLNFDQSKFELSYALSQAEKAEFCRFNHSEANQYQKVIADFIKSLIQN